MALVVLVEVMTSNEMASIITTQHVERTQDHGMRAFRVAFNDMCRGLSLFLAKRSSIQCGEEYKI